MEEREQLAQLWEKVLPYIDKPYIKKQGYLCFLINHLEEYHLISKENRKLLKRDLKQCNLVPELYKRYNMKGRGFYWDAEDENIRKWFIQERIKDLRGICTTGTLKD